MLPSYHPYCDKWQVVVSSEERGGGACPLITTPTMCARCSRYLLPHLSAQNASSLLDAGLSYYEDKLDPYLKRTKSPGCPQVSST